MKKFISKFLCFVMCISFCTFPEVHAAESYEETEQDLVMYGDINDSGRVNIHDYNYLKKHLVKESFLDSSSLKRADMNKDGIVNVFDLVMLKRKISNTNIYLDCDTKKISTDKEETTVYFYADVYLENVTVSLYDALTDELVMEMLDDGKYSVSGDDLPSDGIYSCRFEIDNSEEKTFYYYAKIEETGETSDYSKIKVYKPLTSQDLEDMNTVNNEINSLFQNEQFTTLSIDEQRAELETLLDKLIEDGLVQKDSVSYNASSKMLSYKYKCGIMGSITLTKK